MADNVAYTPGSGVTVAADEVGGVLLQRVKVVTGSDGTNLGDIGPTNPMPISGTVQVSGPVQISGTVTAGAGTTVVSVTGSAQVSGTVSVSGAVQVSGTVTIAPTTFTVNTAGTVAGASITVQQGVSVSAVVSGTVSILNVVPVVTQASVSVSGFPVWMNPTQAVVVNTIAAGFSVNALVTGVVSVSVMPAVSISVSAALGTVITILGTQMVSIAQTSVSMAALPTVNTIITILGTQVVTVVPGLSVSAVVSGTVNVSGVNFTAAGPSVAASGLVIWLAGGQSSTAWPVVITGTVTAGAGTTVVSLTGSAQVSGTVTVSGMLMTTTGVTTGTAQAVWIMNPTTVTVTLTGTGTVNISSWTPVTTQASVSVSGMPVWFNPNAQLLVSPYGDGIAFSFTTVSAPTVQTPALCNVAWQGTTVQTSMYVVPAGRNLVINAIGVIVQNTAASVGIARGEVYIRASVSSSVTVGPVIAYGLAAALTSATNAGGVGNISALGVRITAGQSVGLAYKCTGNTGQIIGFVIMGNLF